VGGPFTPSDQVYTVTNPGEASIDFYAICPADWVTVTPGTGTIDPGGDDQVTVAIAAGAADLPVGTYDTQVTFSTEPDGAGGTIRAVSLTVSPADAVLHVSPATGLAAGGVEGGPFTPSNQVYTVTNSGEVSIDFYAACTADWVTVTPGSGTIAPGGGDQVTVAIAAAADDLAAGTYTTQVTFSTEPDGTGGTTRGVTLTVGSQTVEGDIVITALAPNPFGEFVEIRYTLAGPAPVHARILDLRGRLVRNLGTQSGLAGDNTIVWNGQDDAGRSLPAGKYVCELTSSGHTLRCGLVMVH
jgi:hypothetical protein